MGRSHHLKPLSDCPKFGVRFSKCQTSPGNDVLCNNSYYHFLLIKYSGRALEAIMLFSLDQMKAPVP